MMLRLRTIVDIIRDVEKFGGEFPIIGSLSRENNPLPVGFPSPNSANSAEMEILAETGGRTVDRNHTD